MFRYIWTGMVSLVLLTGLPAVMADQAGQAAVDKRLLTIDDYDGTLSVGAPRLSPDGGTAAFESGGQVHVVATGGGPSRPVTSASSKASDPAWSVDGEALYFLSDRSGSSQLWKLPVSTFGEAVQVTALEFPVNSFTLSPDGTRFLFSRREPRDNEQEEGKTEPWVIDRLQFKEDAGDGYITNDTPRHVYVYDMEAKAVSPVTTGDYSSSAPAWSPDGKSVVFVSNREPDPDVAYRTDLWRVGIGEAGTPLRLTDSDWVKQSPAWSPDGSQIAYITAEDGVYGIQHVAVIPAAGGEPRLITEELDRWVTAFRYSADGRFVYVQFDCEGGSSLARIDLASGGIEPVAHGDYVVSGFDLNSSGKVVARISTNNSTPDIYAVNGPDPVRLTDMNRAFFSGLWLGARQKVEFSSADGTRVEAFVTMPPDYEEGKRYPAILKIHGGPVGQFTWEYDFGAQFFAANGYVVVEPNPRGSTGQGQAFINAIYKTWGITDYDDVIGAIDHVIEMGIADPDRLAVFGYSYGGYMTNVTITRTKRFKAAASGAGHSLIIANYGHDIYQKWYNWELGGPWTNMGEYDALSPLLRVGEVDTPTIFLGGREDWNVPVLNAELFYQSLRQRGIPSRLVVYPDSHHGGWDPRFYRDYYSRIVGWFDEYVKQAGEE